MIGPFLLLLCGLSGVAHAQPPPEAAPPSLRVTASATVTTAPDRVEIDIGVTTQARSSKEAASQNAERIDLVIAEVRREAGAAATVETVHYSVRPDYRQPENRKPEISGYTVANVVRVTLDDLAKAGDIIDAATRSGANEIRRLQFGLKDPQAIQAQALRAAAANARSQADALAAALGVKVVRILSAADAGSPVRPMADVMFAARAEALATPVEPGMIEVSATVTLTVEIGDTR